MFVVLLIAATFAAYLPAIQGGFIWDDDAHVTRPDLRGTDGLWRIWFEVGATQQYYPLMHSAFWLQHRLWGDRTPGYHAVNISLHALNAVLVMMILRRLLSDRGARWADPAAMLAAAVFALHPVHVESVAWITELKNTLSGTFYLSAMLVYLSFDESRRTSHYALASALFIMGLLTKTVTATLPAAILVILWWKRGTLSWKRDAWPLLPWFVLGAASGIFTAWVEHQIIGAKGQAFDLSIIERFLLAGRVTWFYLFKLLWPAELIFIYPRWTIDAASWEQWLYPLSMALLLGLLLVLAIRRRVRAPLAAMLFFGGSLFPVLGFFNVYPFLFSFVADHFQYLPSLGIITLASCAIAAAASRVPSAAARWLIVAAIPLVLGVLSCRQARMYADVVTLYETTIARNPACWMAHNNLGVQRRSRGEVDLAIAHYREALRLRPEYPEAHNNLGLALHATGRSADALASFDEALRLRPANPEVLGNRATSLAALGRFDESVASLKQAIAYDPGNAGLHFNLGVVLQSANRSADAAEAYRRALAIDPALPGAREQLDRAIAASQPAARSIESYLDLLRRRPDDAEAHFAVAVLLADANRLPEAIEHYEAAVRLRPGHVESRNNLGSLLMRTGRPADAVPHLHEAARLLPDHIGVRMNLASALAGAGRIDEALAEASRARELALAAGEERTAANIERWMQERRANTAGRSAPQ